LATVKALVAANAFVSVVDKTELDIDLAEHSSIRFNQTDITKTEEIRSALEATISWTEQTGAKLGGVINCAGIGGRQLVRPLFHSSCLEADANLVHQC
jgi:NAD(P)-dependent dehydrogenase (short-subunit alcohol dehydrogenase family)